MGNGITIGTYTQMYEMKIYTTIGETEMAYFRINTS